MAVLFDTLKLAERLEAAGMPLEQAKGTTAVLAEGLTDTVATAADIETVRGEIRDAELRLRGEIMELRGEVHEVEARLRGEIEKVRSDVRGWLVTQAFAIIGAVGFLVGLAAVLSRLIH